MLTPPNATTAERPVFIDDDARWQAVRTSDARADGCFVYAVITTGIYCRPSCRARRPRRENTRFFASAAKAERAGYRACRRCQPDAASRQAREQALIEKACALIRTADELPTLQALAASLDVSPYHFHRLFKRITGMTPKAFAIAERQRRVRDTLPAARSVTEALFDAGYNASSRFYADAQAQLGMAPSRYRARGQGETLRFAIGACTYGAILVAATERGICHISLGDDPAALLDELHARFASAELIGDDDGFNSHVATVIGFVERPASAFPLPLDIAGTAFQQRVWQALRAIPFGTTVSYADIAARIGQPAAVRAVARACASNTLAVAIPCHRVVRTDGGLGGYRWGLERKEALLAREAPPAA